MLAWFWFGGTSMADDCSTWTAEWLRELLSHTNCGIITLTDDITITPAYTWQWTKPTAIACWTNDSSICINRAVTIDWGGKTISYSEMPRWLSNWWNYLFKTNIWDTVTEITLKNLNISTSLGWIFLYWNTKLTLENVSFSDLEWGWVEIQNNASPTITITDVNYDESIETPFAWVDWAYSWSLNWSNSSNILDCHFIEKPNWDGYQKQYFCFLKKLNTKTYYTSDSTDSTEFKLVLNDDGSFLNKTGTLYILWALYDDNDKKNPKKLYAQLSWATAEQLSNVFQTWIIENEEVLFLRLGSSEQTKVFRAVKDGALSWNAFKPSTYTIPASQVSFSTWEADRVAPSWITDFSSENLSWVIEVWKWYIVHTKKWGLFYAPRMYKVIFNTNAEWVANPEAKELKYWEKVDEPAEPTYTWYIFQWWYLNDEVFKFTTPITESITLTGKWEAITPSTWDAEDETTYASGFVFDAEEWLTWTDTKSSIESAVASSNSNATMQWAAELNVYSDKDDDDALDPDKDELITKKVNFSGAVAVKIPVQWEVAAVKVKVRHNGETTFGTEWLTTDSAATCNDWIASAPYNGSDIKVTSGYAEIYTCSASTFIAYTETANPTSSSSSYSGGWGGSSKSTTKTNTWDTKATTWDTAKVDEEKSDETKDDEDNTEEQNPTMTDEEAIAKYGQEQVDAYKWALENWITTMPTIEKARLDQPLTRAELAKMMVVYMAKIMDKSPVVTGDVNYKDVDADELNDLALYIKLAYQYQIMWINADGTPIENFNPYGLVTRWEYATVFSRVLFGDKFNKDWADFYTNHLEALKKAGILKDTTPTMQEIRGWVMLMMYRSSKNSEEISKVAAEVEATDEEKAEAEAKAEEETTTETSEETSENAEPAEENAEATTWDVVETPEAEATTWDVAETPAEASTWDTASN